MSKYFTDKEVGCLCGCGKLPEPEIMVVADLLREGWGPLGCSSGARCLQHTLKLRKNGTPAALKSAHIDGLALDLYDPKGRIKPLQEYIRSRLKELDIYMEDPLYTPSWTHITTRPPASGERVFRP